MLLRIITLVTYIHANVAAPEAAGAEPQETRAQEGAAQAPSSLVPDITPPLMRRDWQAEHRFLQAGTGVSWTLVGLGIIGMAIPLGMLSRCNQTAQLGAEVDCADERRAAGITAPILGVMTLASLVPAVLFTRKLIRHRNERPTAELRFAPGGVVLRF